LPAPSQLRCVYQDAMPHCMTVAAALLKKTAVPDECGAAGG
jgi:hypothetical protein